MLFTDGFTPDERDADAEGGETSRIGWLAFDKNAQSTTVCSWEIPDAMIDEWVPRKNQIGMIEMFAPVQALNQLRKSIRNKRVILLVDSEAVEGALVKGYSRAEDLCELTAVFWQIVAEEGCSIYIDRVSTDSNPADGPSRDAVEDLVKRGAKYVDPIVPEFLKTRAAWRRTWREDPAGEGTRRTDERR